METLIQPSYLSNYFYIDVPFSIFKTHKKNHIINLEPLDVINSKIQPENKTKSGTFKALILTLRMVRIKL